MLCPETAPSWPADLRPAQLRQRGAPRGVPSRLRLFLGCFLHGVANTLLHVVDQVSQRRLHRKGDQAELAHRGDRMPLAVCAHSFPSGGGAAAFGTAEGRRAERAEENPNPSRPRHLENERAKKDARVEVRSEALASNPRESRDLQDGSSGESSAKVPSLICKGSAQDRARRHRSISGAHGMRSAE